MNFKCKIGLHTWNRCKCTKCHKTREEQHNWASECEKCSICGKTRNNQHKWGKWDNDCKCSKCGKIRDEHHNWYFNCEICSKCGKTRKNNHEWTKDCEKCSKCAMTRDNQHEWDSNRKECSKCGKNYTEFIVESFIKKGADYKLILSNITDQLLLAKIATTIEDKSIVKIAIGKIWDQKILTKICDFATGNNENELKMNLSLLSINLLIISNNLDSGIAEKLKIIIPRIHEICANENTSHGGITLWQYYYEWVKSAESFLESYSK